MCDCIDKLNKTLAPANARLATRQTFNMMSGKTGEVLPVPLEKIDGKKRKALPVIFPLFCVFCGEKRATK